MQPQAVNARLNDYEINLVSKYLQFPDNQTITAVDFRCGNGSVLSNLTRKHHGEKYLFGAEEYAYDYNQAQRHFHKVCNAHYDSDSKITDGAFSLAFIDPKVQKVIVEDVLTSFDSFIEPNFENEERRRLEIIESQRNMIDLGDMGLTEEQIEKRDEEFEKKLKEAIKERRLAFRRALREQEKALSRYRDDSLLLAKVSKKLMPGGILVLVTPKELIDQTLTMRLASQFEDIRIFRLPDLAYEDKRKCIIIAKKRKKTNEDFRKEGFRLAETKLTPFKRIPVIGELMVDKEEEIVYRVPVQRLEAVNNFRVGPLTAAEVSTIMNKSVLLGNYQNTYSQISNNEEPIAPTPLHKGHIMLLLTSGFLNGYIGKGANQHLVKGTAVKMSREFAETDDEGVTTVKEREYYHISVKLLNRMGEFRKLM